MKTFIPNLFLSALLCGLVIAADPQPVAATGVIENGMATAQGRIFASLHVGSLGRAGVKPK